MLRLRSSILACCLMLLSACQKQLEPVAFVARVGDAYLMEEDLDAALGSLPVLLDSIEVRKQVIEQWVSRELLYQEALRRNLRSQETVRDRLQEGERAVLIDALVSLLYEESTEIPSMEEVRAYFELHKEHMLLREPFVRVRYLYGANRDSVQRAHQWLRQTPQEQADSVFLLLANRFSADATVSKSLSENYVPESHLFVGQPELREQLMRLQPGQLAPLIATDSHTHLLQLTDRVPTGELPELPWVEEQVRRQLTMDTRKQVYERQVQRLRMEALSREVLVIK